MSEGPQSKCLAQWLNPRKLAYQGSTIKGRIAHRDLPRTGDILPEIGEIVLSLSFSLSDQGKPQVMGRLEGDLQLICQRCLETMAPNRIEVDLALGVVRSDEEAKALPRSLDPWWVPEDDANIFALVEDELLLAAPAAAYHDDPHCNGYLPPEATDSEAEDGGERENPFSVLAQLKDRSE